MGMTADLPPHRLQHSFLHPVNKPLENGDEDYGILEPAGRGLVGFTFWILIKQGCPVPENMQDSGPQGLCLETPALNRSALSLF